MKKNSILIILVIAIICTIGVGYAYLESKLNIEAGVSITKHCNDKNTLYGKIMCEANDASGKVLEMTNNDLETDAIADSPTIKKSIRYFSGEVTNNNIIFAGLCWKAYRTTETEGVKIIYNGPVQEGNTCSNEAAITLETPTAYNEYLNSLSQIGYKYNTSYNFTSKTFTTEEMVEANAITFSSTVSFDENTKYSLGEETTTYYDWSNYTNALDSYHYTCLNNETNCESIKYVYNVDAENSTIYYIELNEGKQIEDALTEMLNNSAVNSNDSLIKTALEEWYATNISTYDTYLEDTVYCNDRSIATLAGWSPTGSMTTYFQFNPTVNKNLTCVNAIDRFTTSDIGNAKNTYKVGLLTAGEATLVGTNVLNSGTAYWLMRPSTIDGTGVKNFYVTAEGILSTDYTNTSYGIRPVVSLTAGVTIKEGEGTLAKPYIINTEE